MKDFMKTDSWTFGEPLFYGSNFTKNVKATWH